MKFRLEYAAFKGLITLFASLPGAGREKWGKRLGRIWYALDGKHRKLALDNIARSLEVEGEEAGRIARRTFENLGISAAEFAAFGKFEEIRDKVDVEGVENLEGALALGKGVFLLSGHCGNWELGAAMAAGYVPLTAVVRPMKNPLTDRLINDLRRRGGLNVMGHRNSTKPILRKLGAGEAVGILLDQNTSHREAVFCNFFGRPAAVNSGLALLVVKTGAPVVPVFLTRGDGGRQLFRFEAPVEIVRCRDRREELGVNSALFTSVLEAYIRLHPDHWFWVHNRWKNQPRPGDKVYGI